MSVDTLRENFHINRISVKDLQDFLTAQTYRPEITDVKHKILALNHVSLQSVCSKPIRQGKSPKYTENTGLICIKPRNTNSMLVSADEVDWIEPSTKAEIQNQKLVYGDVVITRSGSGTIGRASVYPYAEEAYVNDHLFIVRPSSADSHYVCSYLKSYFGERLLESGISGSTGQLNLSNEHIKAVPLFFPKPDAQKYIGEKVRQAERLRAWAKSIKQTLQEFENDIPVKKYPRTNKKYAISRTFDLTENRLDAEFYEDKHIDLSRQFNGEFSSLGALTTGFKYGSSVKADYVEKGKGIPFVRGNALTDNEISSSDIVYLDRSLTDELKSNFLNIGDVMITRSGTVGVACDVYEGFDKYAYGSFIINSKPKSEVINPLYLSWYLNSWVGQQQFRRWENGAVQLNINTEELASIEVWTAPNEFQLKIAEQIKLLRAVNRLAQCLIASAKWLVEDLIEGQVTESQLVSAQQALDAGDDSLDRALLERMTAEGIDGEGDPLFDDIDQLYDLLEQAKQALDAEDSMTEV